MKNFSLLIFAIILLTLTYLLSCNQTSNKYDVLNSKIIEESSGTLSTVSTKDNSGSSSFKVYSLPPLGLQTSESRIRATILKTFSENIRLKNTSGSWTTTWTTRLTSEGAWSVNYSSNIFHTLSDNFSSCTPENSYLSGKSITLTQNEVLSSLDNYKEKILKTSIEGTASTQSFSRVQLSTKYTLYFKTKNFNFSFLRT